MNYFHFYGTQFVLFSTENTLQSRVNKQTNVHVGDCLVLLSIDYHLAKIARVGPGMAAGRGLASFLGRGLVGGHSGVTTLVC